MVEPITMASVEQHHSAILTLTVPALVSFDGIVYAGQHTDVRTIPRVETARAR